jgi:hypothetical protein
MRSTKIRESLRHEQELKRKLDKKIRKEKRAKEDKDNLDKLMKKNHTYDYKGSIMIVHKPNMDKMPVNFNMSTVSQNTFKKNIIHRKMVDESLDDTILKFFSNKPEFEVENKIKSKNKGKSKSKEGKEVKFKEI